MQLSGRSPHLSLQQFFVTATVVALLLTGILPALHDHQEHQDDAAVEAHCQEWGSRAATHLETLELEHREPCGLCLQVFSSSRLERPLATLVDELVSEHLFEISQVLPPGAPGRNGASRAPPFI